MGNQFDLFNFDFLCKFKQRFLWDSVARKETSFKTQKFTVLLIGGQSILIQIPLRVECVISSILN